MRLQKQTLDAIAVAIKHLKNGGKSRVKSWREIVTKHGHAGSNNPSPTYRTWTSMIQRCCNKNSPDYPRYGGRGIKVCRRWRSFKNFLADMGERPDGKTLDRYPDNDGGYKPGNCRWATPKEQQANTRRKGSMRVYSGPNGIKTIKQWAEISGTKCSTIANRYYRGFWTAKESVFGRK